MKAMISLIKTWETPKKQLDLISNFIAENYEAFEELKLTSQQMVEDKLYCVYHFHNSDIFGVTFFKEETKRIVYTRTTVVKKKLRGRGIGLALNESAEKAIKDLGYKKMTCNIYDDNIPNIVLKIKNGWKVEGRLMDHDDDCKNEYILSKWL